MTDVETLFLKKVGYFKKIFENLLLTFKSPPRHLSPVRHWFQLINVSKIN